MDSTFIYITRLEQMLLKHLILYLYLATSY